MKTSTYIKQLRKNQTRAESYFWSRVRSRQLLGLKFRRQHLITHSQINGFFFSFIADFYIPSCKLIVEIDGEIHEEHMEYDMCRTQILTNMGYSVIRFTNEMVLSDWSEVEKELLRKLR